MTRWLPALPTQPGRTLAYCLPFPADLGRIVTSLLGGVLFLPIGGGLLFAALHGFAEHRIAGGLVVLIMAGFILLVVYSAFADLVRTVRIARTVPANALEVSHAPVRPGEPFDLRVELPRTAKLRAITVTLVCEELTMYWAGKVLKTKRHKAFEKIVVSSNPMAEGRSGPFVHAERLTLPPDAMHSFAGKFNHIQWRIVVAVTPRRSLKFEREAPLVVHPAKPRRPGTYREAGRA
jgi:hypothetical protein